MMSVDNAQSPIPGRKVKSAIELLLSREPEPPETTRTTETTPNLSTWNSHTASTSSSLPNPSRELEPNFRQLGEKTLNAQPVSHQQSLPSMAQLTESLGQSGSAPPPYGLSGPTSASAQPAMVGFEETRRISYESKPNHILRHRNADMPQIDSPSNTNLATREIAPRQHSLSRSQTPHETPKQLPPFREGNADSAGSIAGHRRALSMSHGKGDPLAVSRYSGVHKSVNMNAYKRDMERVEDWASKLYHFATFAGVSPNLNQTGNTGTDFSDEQNMPSAAQFDLALRQCRSITGVLQTWMDSQYDPLSTTSLPTPHLINHGSTSSAGDFASGPTPPSSHDYGTTFASNGETSWDFADEQAMKYRKRSAPKRVFGLGSVSAGPVPIVPAATTSTSTTAAQNMHVARQALPGRCHSCNIAETPEWRRGPDGARTLCNACGLHFAKLTKRKQQSIQGRNEAG